MEAVFRKASLTRARSIQGNSRGIGLRYSAARRKPRPPQWTRCGERCHLSSAVRAHLTLSSLPGTFSHRHAVAHDFKDYDAAPCIPLAALDNPEKHATFSVSNRLAYCAPESMSFILVAATCLSSVFSGLSWVTASKTPALSCFGKRR